MPEPRIFHVFKSKARLWTRCGDRVRTYDTTLTHETAMDARLWRHHDSPMRDGVICVRCAALLSIRFAN